MLLFVYLGFVSVSFVFKLDYLRSNRVSRGYTDEFLSLENSEDHHRRVRREAESGLGAGKS